MLCKPFFCAPLCIRNGFLFKGACFTLFPRAVLPCICLPQNRMSVRVMVCQCAAVLSSAASEFAFSKVAEFQSRVPPFELCRGMCPFRVMHAHKCNGCQNTDQRPLFGLGQWTWALTEQPFPPLPSPLGAGLKLCGGIFENDSGVPFSFGVIWRLAPIC